ncbi:MAG: hypothetical protein AAGA33_06375 [Pseudomonadota bacterium]
MQTGKRLSVLAACGLLVACAAPDPAALARGTAKFLVVAASQDEYVEGCTLRGSSDLECQAEYNDTRAGHRAHYRAEKKKQHQQAVNGLSDELDAYLKSVEQGSEPD